MNPKCGIHGCNNDAVNEIAVSVDLRLSGDIVQIIDGRPRGKIEGLANAHMAVCAKHGVAFVLTDLEDE